MRKSVLVALMLLIALYAIGSEGIIRAGSAQTGVFIEEESSTSLDLVVNMNELEYYDVNTSAGEFTGLRVNGFTSTKQTGKAELPRVRKIFMVPLEAEISLEMGSYKEKLYDLSDLGITTRLKPAQPSLSKSMSAEEIEFIYDQASYEVNGFGEDTIAELEELGILRGLRLFVVDIQPVKYNPVTSQLKIYNNIEIHISYSGGDYAGTESLRQRTWSPYYEQVFSQRIINYQRLELRDDLTRYPIKYVIISDDMFEDQLQEFIDWKTMQGYEVIEAYTGDIGSSTGAIQGYIQDLWDEATPADPAPSFILFVGDTAQIPAYNGSEGSHVTDLNYVRLEGNDYMPEIYYGRFSAQNVAQLQPQIDKTLEYERYEMPDPSYLSEAVMIAGVDSYHGSDWGNGQINYGTTYYFNEDHGITSHTYLYPDSGNNASNIVQNVSDGVGYINYTAHGGSDSWSNPSFTISNINGLQNLGKYCFAVGNCCLTNKFEVATCFGEAWLRAENKGAIGYIGGTNSTYWDEDYWWGVGAGAVVSNPTFESHGAGAYDGMWHDHGEEFSQWFTTGYAYIMAGNLAVAEGGGSINYYWEIYALMGDPSLSVYFGVPETNEAEYPEEILLGLDTMEITAEPYSYVGLSYEGELMGYGLVDDSGYLELTYQPFTDPCLATLTITRQNREPIIAEIQVIPNEGAYLNLDAYEILAGDDEVINGGDEVAISLSIENLGMEDATDTELVIGCADEYVEFEAIEFELGLIPSETIIEFSDLINFTVAEDIPFGHPIRMDLQFTSGESSWLEELNLSAYAPPGLWIEPGEIIAEVDSTQTYQTTFAISNYLEDEITYSIRTESEDLGRDLTDCYVECSHHHFEPGGEYEWTITARNMSPDGEWITDVSVSFPEGVVIEDASMMTGASGGDMEPDVTSGNGVTINWHGATPSGYGYLHEMQSAQAVVNVSIDEDFMGYISCDYIMTGDEYGSEPHEVSGMFELSYPLSWIILDNTEGTVGTGQTDFIGVTLNPEGMETGSYQCEIVITDSRQETRIPVTMTILPPSSSEESLLGANAVIGNYPNPFNPETLISYNLPASGEVSLEIYNIKGQKVLTLIEGRQEAGLHQVAWKGTDAQNQAVGSGLYFYVLKTTQQSYSGKMMLLK